MRCERSVASAPHGGKDLLLEGLRSAGQSCDVRMDLLESVTGERSVPGAPRHAELLCARPMEKAVVGAGEIVDALEVHVPTGHAETLKSAKKVRPRRSGRNQSRIPGRFPPRCPGETNPAQIPEREAASGGAG